MLIPGSYEPGMTWQSQGTEARMVRKTAWRKGKGKPGLRDMGAGTGHPFGCSLKS